MNDPTISTAALTTHHAIVFRCPSCEQMTDRDPCEHCGHVENDKSAAPEDPPPPFYTVAVFMVDQRYGGPEEGGWYYLAGEPVEDDPDLPLPVVCKTEEEANSAVATVQATLDATVNVGRRSIYSVLSQGRYEARACAGYPRPFPERRPHYE